jgi:hypothetical protein
MEEIGSVDYAIVAFPGNKFRSEIALSGSSSSRTRSG